MLRRTTVVAPISSIRRGTVPILPNLAGSAVQHSCVSARLVAAM